MARPVSSRAARAFVRRAAGRASGAAADRYRDAVLGQSRWLPAYLTAVDAVDVTLRARRRIRGNESPSTGWDRPAPTRPAVEAAGLSTAGELSLALCGPSTWLQSISGVALVTGAERIDLDDALITRAAGRVQVTVALPAARPASGPHRVALLDASGAEVEQATTPSRAVRAGGPRTARLEIADGALVLVSDGPPPGIAHRVSTGVARIDVRWTPPPGGATELVLRRPDGTAAAHLQGRPDGETLLATLDARTPELAGPAVDGVLTPTVPGPDGPLPLVLDGCPPLDGAPAHGTARLGTLRARAGYDGANRLQITLRRVS